MNDNTCVCCGEPIPEGRQVCPKCEKGGDIGMELVFNEENGTWGEAPEVYGVINCPTKEDYEYALNAIKSYKQLEDKHWNECRQIAHYEDELRTFKGWINVDDRLPDDYNICLVWYRYDGAFGVGEGYGLSCYHPDTGWRKTELQGDNIGVLYWQQLPEQPLEKSLIG